jgi:hypothetical protein
MRGYHKVGVHAGEDLAAIIARKQRVVTSVAYRSETGDVAAGSVRAGGDGTRAAGDSSLSGSVWDEVLDTASCVGSTARSPRRRRRPGTMTGSRGL